MPGRASTPTSVSRTVSSAAIRRRFPNVREPKQQDICYATQNRQDAVELMSPQVDVVIVVGSPTSSNSNRLAELARKLGVESYMVDNAAELRAEWLAGKERVGLTAGASAPGSERDARRASASGRARPTRRDATASVRSGQTVQEAGTRRSGAGQRGQAPRSGQELSVSAAGANARTVRSTSVKAKIRPAGLKLIGGRIVSPVCV